MTWKWQRFEETLEGFGPLEREIATNDTGVSVKPWGTWGAHRAVLFKYIDKDIEVEFMARRSPKSVAEYGEIDISGPDFPLGPICSVWFDDRTMKFVKKRPVSAEQRATIEKTFTDFF